MSENVVSGDELICHGLHGSPFRISKNYFSFTSEIFVSWDQREFETSPNRPTTFTWISKFQNVLEIKI